MTFGLKAITRAALRTGLALLFVTAMARPASADWLFTPYYGIVFGGAANTVDIDTLDEAFEQRSTFGGSLSGTASGIFGFEIDFSYSPNFFQDTAGAADFDFGDSNVTTLMGNVLIGASGAQGVRPYASGGVGLIRSHIDAGAFFDELDTNDFGGNIGGGIQGYFNDNVGIRGDIRYFRSFQDNEPDDEFDLALSSFDFWRGTVGVTFRW